MLTARVTGEGIEAAAEAGLIFNPWRHRLLPDGPWIKAVRRAVRMPNLFVYLHLETGAFVLAGWLVKGKVCCELEMFPAPPDLIPDFLPSMDDLNERLRPAVERKQEMVRGMKDRIAERNAARRESAMEAAAMGQHLIRKGQTEAGIALRDGYTPYVGRREAGEAIDQVTDALKGAGRIIG